MTNLFAPFVLVISFCLLLVLLVTLCSPLCVSLAGIVTELECEEAFYGRLEKLRSVLKSRTAVYATEEKALMVMLEGEQEEERMREREKQVKNEMDKWLQKKQSVDAMLFGGESVSSLSNTSVTEADVMWSKNKIIVLFFLQMASLLILSFKPLLTITARLNTHCAPYCKSGLSSFFFFF